MKHSVSCIALHDFGGNWKPIDLYVLRIAAVMIPRVCVSRIVLTKRAEAGSNFGIAAGERRRRTRQTEDWRRELPIHFICTRSTRFGFSASERHHMKAKVEETSSLRKAIHIGHFDIVSVDLRRLLEYIVVT